MSVDGACQAVNTVLVQDRKYDTLSTDAKQAANAVSAVGWRNRASEAAP
jgi:hypothetical protein